MQSLVPIHTMKTLGRKDSYSLRTEIAEFNVKLYCDLRGRQTGIVLMERIPRDVPKEAFLFRGAPDFTLQWFPVLAATTDGDSSLKSELDTSGESLRVEHSLQIPTNNPHKYGSFIPDKGGELCAEIHQAIQAKVLRRLMKNKPIHFPIIGHGLYLHKITGTVHFQLTLNLAPGKSMEIRATSFDSGIINKKSLCSSISSLSHLKKPKQSASPTL